ATAPAARPSPSGEAVRMWGGAQPIEFPPRELEIVPCHAAILGARIPQKERRVERRHEYAVAILVEAATQLGDALACAEQGLRGEIAQGEDHRGSYRVELRHQEGVACRDLVRLGVAVALGSALHDVGDVSVALTVEAHRLQHLREELAGAAHEGLALLVL